MPSFPQRPPSHIIGDEAVRIFMSLCPSEWVISSLQPDYGLDLRVELTRDGSVTGEEFYVQVKGKISVKDPRKLTTAVTIPQATINYWLGKLPPVVVVLVDTHTRRFWFEWLERAYPDYPRSVDSQRKVRMILRSNGDDALFANEVPAYVGPYYSHLMAELSNLSQRTHLTRLVFHTSALHRRCVDLALEVQGGFVKPEEFQDAFFWWVQEFAWHNQFLRGLWEIYEASSFQPTDVMVGLLGAKLKAYVVLREKWFMFDQRKEAGDFALVPASVTSMFKYLLPTIGALSDLEEVMLQALALGKVLFAQTLGNEEDRAERP